MKINRKQILSVTILILCAILVFGRAHIIALLKGEPIHKGPSVSIIKSHKIENESMTYGNIYGAGDYYFLNNSGTLTAYHKENGKLWSKKVGESVEMFYNADKLLVGEKKRGDLYVFDMEGKQISSAVATGPLSKLELLSDGRIVVVSASANRIDIFSPDFAAHHQIKIGSGKIVKYDIFEPKNEIAIVVLEEDKKETFSSVYLYSLENDLKVYKKFDDILVDVFFWRKGVLLVYSEGLQLSDENLETIDVFSPFGDILALHKKNSLMLMVTAQPATDNAPQQMSLIKYDLIKKKADFSVPISKKYDRIYLGEGFFIVHDGAFFELRDLNGDLIYEKESNFNIKRLFLLNDGYILISDTQRINLLKIDRR